MAILTITKRALKLANNLKSKLNKDPTVFNIDIYHKSVKNTLNRIFHDYDCIIGIMATGIMVRILSGLPKNKLADPAILIIDEYGKHVISLLSGHMGGANEYTLKIAALLDSKPVITTATDLSGKMGVDSFARKYYLQIDNHNQIKCINKCILKEKVTLVVPSNFSFLEKDPLVKQTFSLEIAKKDFQARHEQYNIKFKPRKIVVGIGSKQGIKRKQVINALNSTFTWLNLPIERADIFATAEPKKDEKGIIEASKIFGKPLKVVSSMEIKKFHHPQIDASPLVERKIGLPGVCEPSALITAGNNSRLIFRKTAFDGVTVAVATS